MSVLKYVRWALAALVGGLILFYFLDFAGVAPKGFNRLLHLQIVPALLSGGLAAVVLFVVLSLLFGRVYCSVICPLGILQDFILRFKIWYFGFTKKRKKYRTQYAKPLNYVRYGVFGVVGVFFALGISYPLLLLDPYSNFGRMAVGLFRSTLIGVNNAAASLLASMGNYSLYRVPVDNTTWLVVGFAATMLILLVALVWRRERIWCNTMCPVGTLLGFVSRFSLFRITLSDNCNNCKSCASSCKSRCIDSENRTVDMSRCVTCFDCIGKCKKDAIAYSPRGWGYGARVKSGSPVEAYSIYGTMANGSTLPVDATVDAVKAPASPETIFAAQEKVPVVHPEGIAVSEAADLENELTPAQLARRRFIKGSLITAAAVASAKFLSNDLWAQGGKGHGAGGGHCGGQRVKTRYPLPPGAVSLQRFREKCTACQLCISKCPTQVLQPAFLENGLTGMMQPYMKFRTESFCNYDCRECIDICPNHAILPLTLEEKKLTRVGNVHFLRPHCVVVVQRQDCGACAEHCPTQAVRMVPFGDGTLTIPEIRPELCIGCGGCESICPVSPPAIFVEGLAVQEVATPPSDDEIEEVKIDDFGF